IVLVLGLCAVRRARLRAARGGIRRRLRAVGGSLRARGEGAALREGEHAREQQHGDSPEGSETAIMAHGLDLVVSVDGWRETAEGMLRTRRETDNRKGISHARGGR